MQGGGILTLGDVHPWGETVNSLQGVEDWELVEILVVHWEISPHGRCTMTSRDKVVQL